MDGRGGLLSAGGILSIIIGAFELICGGMIATLTRLSTLFLHPRFPFFPGFGGDFNMTVVSTWLVIIGGILAVLGIVAIVGGISAVRRGSFGLSLAGAICALPSGALGILAVIFVSLARGEFK